MPVLIRCHAEKGFSIDNLLYNLAERRGDHAPSWVERTTTAAIRCAGSSTRCPLATTAPRTNVDEQALRGARRPPSRTFACGRRRSRVHGRHARRRVPRHVEVSYFAGASAERCTPIECLARLRRASTLYALPRTCPGRRCSYVPTGRSSPINLYGKEAPSLAASSGSQN